MRSVLFQESLSFCTVLSHPFNSSINASLSCGGHCLISERKGVTQLVLVEWADASFLESLDILWKWNCYFLNHVQFFFHPMDCSLLGYSVHGILQAKILGSVTIPFSRGSSWPRDQTQLTCFEGRFCTVWTMRKAPDFLYLLAFGGGPVRFVEANWLISGADFAWRCRVSGIQNSRIHIE